MRTLLLAIISLAAFSTGAVVAKWTRSSRPAPVGPLELLVVIAGLVAVILFRGSYRPLAYGITCAASMFLIGAALALLHHGNRTLSSGGTREFEDASSAEPALSLWKRWLRFSRSIVDYEFRLLLVVCYLVMVGPIAAAFRLLRPEPCSPDSTWIPKNDAPSLDAGRRSF